TTCDRELCLRGGSGIAPTLAGEQSGWVQIGMSSAVTPESYQRPPLSLIAVVDVSCSMGWDYSQADEKYPTPGTLSRDLLARIAGQLGGGDQLAIVTFGGQVKVVLDPTRG